MPLAAAKLIPKIRKLLKGFFFNLAKDGKNCNGDRLRPFKSAFIRLSACVMGIGGGWGVGVGLCSSSGRAVARAARNQLGLPSERSFFFGAGAKISDPVENRRRDKKPKFLSLFRSVRNRFGSDLFGCNVAAPQQCHE